MNRRVCRLGWCPRLLAVVLVALAAAPASAESVTVRNDTRTSLVVQGASLVGGRLVRDRAHLVRAGDSTPAIALPGDKVITIYDPRAPNRAIGQGIVPAGPADQTYRIVPDGGGVRLERDRPPPRR
jgi:hypothetical protein